MKTRVGIIGATGYTGAELVRILSGHPEVDLTILTSRQYAGVPFDQIYPALRGIVSMTCQEFSSERIDELADVAITALPHKIPMTVIPELMEKDLKVIDLSADFRFQDPDIYESYYQPHTAKALLKRAVYGLSEIYWDQIRNAGLIANPGCYPTSILLPLIPLLQQGLIQPDSIIADAKSGVSGAGRSLSLTTHFCQVHESFKPYKVAVHQHNPEINAVLTREAGETVEITFVPHLLPMSRGMLSTIYTDPKNALSEEDVHQCLSNAYSNHPFIRILPGNEMPTTQQVRGTNFCDIGIKMDTRKNRLILISAIDNLVKGAAGQAVQNMNIMLGLPEEMGLMSTPYPI